MRLIFLLIFLMMVCTLGCGGGAEPDVPATLSAEQEQEILEQVEGTAAAEEGKS